MVNKYFTRGKNLSLIVPLALGSIGVTCPNASAQESGEQDCGSAIELVSKENTLDAYDRAVALCPSNGALHYNRSLLLSKAGNSSEAKKAIDKALTLQNDPRFRIAKAKVLEGEGKRDAAAGEYEQALKAEPANQQALQGLASLGKTAATTDLDLPLDNAKTPEAIMAVGVAKLNRNDFAGASAAFEKVLVLDPKNTQARHNFVHSLIKAQRFEAAEKYLRDVRGQFPDDALLISLFGDSLAAQNKFVEAESAYRDAYKATKSDPSVGRSLGLTLLKNKKFKDAASYLQTVVNSGKDDADTESALGFSYLSSDKLEEAEKALRRAVSKDPNHAGAHNNLGMLYFKKGQVDQARASFQKALQLNPNLTEAQANLAQLEKRKKR